jgi:predicted Zn finger-like uncharacterized protein
MKFHCDRCKTRYSIADDRVRGKILKIRCKNCSSVITLKEGGSVSTPRTPRQPTSDGARASAARSRGRRATSTSGSALQGAFEEALRGSQVGVLPDSEPPAVLEAEWYVSHDGEQFGPFPLQKAQDWVSGRGPDDELYCWSEGFDDWLPVEKVSHFRGLRGPEATARHASGLYATSGDRAQSQMEAQVVASSPPPREETPVPLFAATLAQVTAESQPVRDDAAVPMFTRRNGNGSSSVSSLGLPSSRPPTGPGNGGGSLFASAMAAATAAPATQMQGQTIDDPSHDLEIGEASRVVKLPMLARNMGNAAPMSAPGLPGMGGASQAGNHIGRGTGSHDQPARGGSALAGLTVVHGAQSVEMPRPEILQPRRRRSGMAMPIIIGSAIVVGVVSVLLYVALAGGDDEARLRRGDVGGSGLAFQFDDPERDKKGEGNTTEAPPKPRRSVRKQSAPRSTTSATPAPTRAPTGPGFDEVDLSGSDAPRELDPDDVFDVLNANRIGVQMCYNSALKRDPLLKVRRADVAIRVGPSGAVSSVSIPSLSGTQLGLCLEKRIRAWKFPRATEAFNSRFPIVFQNS